MSDWLEEIIMDRYCWHLPAGVCGCDKKVKKIVQAIRAKLEERLPENKDGENWESDNYDAGYNQALADVKEALK